MILRNPSRWRDSVFMACSFFFLISCFPLSAQGIKGYVRDQLSQQPVTNASVLIMQGDALVAELQTDESGAFTFSSSETGRVHVMASADFYKPSMSASLLLDGYTTHSITLQLQRNNIDLQEITVTAVQEKAEPGAFRITNDDLQTVAGNYDDPVRIAHSKPGIVLLNDQANHFAARGHSPVFNTWYLEDLQIVNPSHTNNAGLIDDKATQFGGGINMFSAQMLGSTDFYTGIAPYQIHRAGGASINMNLHETAKPEWRAKAGLLGLEFGGGTGLGEKSVLDFNLRYSFTGLLGAMGVDFGGETIGFYDGVVSYLKEGDHHKLKVFGWAGRSTNEFNRVENVDERERYKDFFDIDYGNNILGAGIRYDASLSDRVFLRTGVSYSTNQNTYNTNGQFGDQPVDIDLDHTLSLVSAFADLTMRHIPRLHTTAGVRFLRRDFKEEFNPSVPFSEETSFRPYLQETFFITPQIKWELGGELFISNDELLVENEIIPGYRTSLQWDLSQRQSLTVALNRTAGPPVLGLTASHTVANNYELGWQLSGQKHQLFISAYYQQMDGLLYHFLDTAYSFVADYPYLEFGGVPIGFSHDGKSTHKGIEGTWKYANQRGWRFELNQSFYKSGRGTEDGEIESGKYDGGFTSNLMLSKEIIGERKGKNRIWNFSLRGLLLGGFREVGIIELQSAEQETTVFQYPGIFDAKLPAFKRLDASISRIISTTNIRWRFALDIQNLLGLTNIAYHYYDPFLMSIETQNHLSIIPVLSVQASW